MHAKFDEYTFPLRNSVAREKVRFHNRYGIELAGDGEPDLSLLQLDLNTTDWTLGEDGYLYYNKPLPAGATTAPIFTTVDFSSSMGNAYQNATATVDVAAQGVQTANNGKTALAASGWPESN